MQSEVTMLLLIKYVLFFCHSDHLKMMHSMLMTPSGGLLICPSLNFSPFYTNLDVNLSPHNCHLTLHLTLLLATAQYHHLVESSNMIRCKVQYLYALFVVEQGEYFLFLCSSITCHSYEGQVYVCHVTRLGVVYFNVAFQPLLNCTLGLREHIVSVHISLSWAARSNQCLVWILVNMWWQVGERQH